MGWESSGVVGFDLGPLLQGQTRIAKHYEISKPRACFPLWLSPRALLFISEHRLHFSPLINTSRQFFALSFIQFRFLAFYRPSLWDWGTVNGTQTGISKTFILLLQNPRKIDYFFQSQL